MPRSPERIGLGEIRYGVRYAQGFAGEEENPVLKQLQLIRIIRGNRSLELPSVVTIPGDLHHVFLHPVRKDLQVKLLRFLRCDVERIRIPRAHAIQFRPEEQPNQLRIDRHPFEPAGSGTGKWAMCPSARTDTYSCHAHGYAGQSRSRFSKNVSVRPGLIENRDPALIK